MRRATVVLLLFCWPPSPRWCHECLRPSKHVKPAHIEFIRNLYPQHYDQRGHHRRHHRAPVKAKVQTRRQRSNRSHCLKKRTVSKRLRPTAFARPRANWTTSVSNPTPISVAAATKPSTQCNTAAFSQTLSRNCLHSGRASSGLSFVEAVFLVLLSCFKRSYRIYIPP